MIRELKYFQGAEAGNWLIARTGYTGELGLEFIIPDEDAPRLWDQSIELGVTNRPGARDTFDSRLDEFVWSRNGRIRYPLYLLTWKRRLRMNTQIGNSSVNLL